MIKFENIFFSYPRQEPLFENFNFEPENGGINIITGASGAGKTTLLNLAAGLILPLSGKITGTEKGVSYVFQEPRLIPEKTVFANLDIALETVISEKTLRHKTIMTALESAGLKDAIKKYPAHLSGGMAQRVALIRALLFPSELILLDEPFKGLDESLRNSLAEMFVQNIAFAQKTALMVTHDADLSYLPESAVFRLEEKPVKQLTAV